MSHFSWAQSASREVLFSEAFKGLPFFVFSAAAKLDPNFQNSGLRLSSFSEEENIDFLKFFKVLMKSHGLDYRLEFVTNPYQQHIFDLRDGQVERTAVTSSVMNDSIFLNMKRINDPKDNIDFIQAIQILLHEVSKKIPDINQAVFDRIAAKLTNSLRTSYSEFKINESRKIHILVLDRPPPQDKLYLDPFKSFWIEFQGFEITTFDETNSVFRPIEEIRHHFAHPQLVNAYNISSDSKRFSLARNNIIGVEVDHFSDLTTMIRINTDQIQSLHGEYNGPFSFGESKHSNEYAITLKGNEPPKVSKRQGYQISSSYSAQLSSFLIKDSTLFGEGKITSTNRDISELKLYLIVRSSGFLLNVPLQIVSVDNQGNIFFKFHRKISEPDHHTILLATDIIVSDSTSTPLNRISLEKSESLKIPEAKSLLSKFEFKSAHAKSQKGWVSLKKKDAKVALGNVPFRFVFQSESYLQEMTLYIEHSKQIYDPNNLKSKNGNFTGFENKHVRPGPFDSSVGNEVEYDVMRIDASQMRQRMQSGQVEVEFSIELRETKTRNVSDGPYYVQMGSGFLGGYERRIESRIDFAVDDEGNKTFSKIVAINENMQKISIDNPQLGVKINGKKGNYLTAEKWKEYQSHFALDLGGEDSNLCKDQF